MIALVAAFGGGVFGALIGALPAFILTGVFATIGGCLTIAGAPEAGFIVNQLAFGSLLGPHISFAGGVAASAYAGRRKITENGADIATPLNGLIRPDVILVGGIFGMLGYVLAYLLGEQLFGNIIGIGTDNPGIAVAASAFIVRLVFGKTGLVGKYTGSEPRKWFPTGIDLLHNIIVGLGFGIVICGIGSLLKDAGADMGMYAVTCFGFSATSLMFAQMGFPSPTSHHITLPAAAAFVLSGNIMIGVVVAVICSLFGEFIGRTFNSHGDSHIDPPAVTIFISIALINAIWG